jgi:hypothetical protein
VVGPFTGGQLLALPMIAIGLGLVVYFARRNVRTDVAPVVRATLPPEESLAI